MTILAYSHRLGQGLPLCQLPGGHLWAGSFPGNVTWGPGSQPERCLPSLADPLGKALPGGLATCHMVLAGDPRKPGVFSHTPDTSRHSPTPTRNPHVPGGGGSGSRPPKNCVPTHIHALGPQTPRQVLLLPALWHRQADTRGRTAWKGRPGPAQAALLNQEAGGSGGKGLGWREDAQKGGGPQCPAHLLHLCTCLGLPSQEPPQLNTHTHIFTCVTRIHPTHAHACTQRHTCVYMHWGGMQMYPYTHAIDVYTHTCTDACTHTFPHAHTCPHTCLSTSQIYRHEYMLTHTHTHTRPPVWPQQHLSLTSLPAPSLLTRRFLLGWVTVVCPAPTMAAGKQ